MNYGNEMKALTAFIFIQIFITGWADAKQDSVALFKSQIQDIVGVEYLVTEAPEGGPAYAQWGHSLLLLRNPKINFWDNLVIQFVADVDESEFQHMSAYAKKNQSEALGYLKAIKDDAVAYSKGLYGGFKVKMTIETLADTIYYSTIYRNQGLQRHILALKKEDKDNLIRFLDEALQRPSEQGSYTFLSNNCAGILSTIFEKSGFGNVSSNVPINISTNLAKAGISPYPQIQVETKLSLHSKIKKALNINSEDREVRDLSDDQIAKLDKTFGHNFLGKLIYADHTVNTETELRIRKFLSPFYKSMNRNEVYLVSEPPVDLYQAPATDVEIDSVNQIRSKFFQNKSYIRDLTLFSSIVEEPEKDSYIDRQLNRIERDKNLSITELQDIPGDLPNETRTELTSDMKLYFKYKRSVKGQLSIYYMDGGYIQPDKIDGNKIYFGKLVCTLNEKKSSLDSNCRLAIKKKGSIKKLYLIGFNVSKN